MHKSEDPPAVDNKGAQKTLGDNRGLMRSATVLAVGNIASRVLGLARDSTLTGLFGAPLVSAYETATVIPNQLFELIIGGMVNSSLVPVFSEYAARDKRDELWRIVSAFLSVAVVVLLVLVLLVELFTEPVATLAGAYELENPALTETAVQLTRLVAPAVLTLSIASTLTGLLYALKRFTIPAFMPALFNGTIVVVALIRPNTITSAVIGLLLGSTLQIVVQLFVLRKARLRWVFDPRHPVLRRILRLYAPIVGGLVINAAVIAFSYNLANRTGDSSLTYMRRATTLIQFPLGLVVTALSVAILPTLAEQSLGVLTDFKETLAGGIRLVLVLILPATAGLFALAPEIVALLFQHGKFTAADTQMTALVLRVYLVGLPFAGVDQMLVFGSYARQDTLRPALVGIASMAVYTVMALASFGAIGAAVGPEQGQLRLLSLMLADAVKHVAHTLLMVWLLRRQIGGLRGQRVLPIAAKGTLAAVVTGAAAYGVAQWLHVVLPLGGLSAELLIVTSAGAVGLIVYGAFVYLLDIQEGKALLRLLRRRS